MTLKLRPRFRVEELEARETPAATVGFFNFGYGPTLFIRGDNTANEIVVQETAGGLFDVFVNGTQQGPDFAAQNLVINMGQGNDTVDLQINTALVGGISANMGGGTDSFTTKNSTVGATVGRAVTICGQGGPALATDYDEVVELYNLTFNGLYVNVIGTPGYRTEVLDLQSASINGNLNVTNFYVTQLGNPGDASGAVTVRNLNINNFFKNTDSRVDAPNGAGNALFMYSGSTVTGNLNYVGGGGRDDLDFPADVDEFGNSNAVDDVFVNGNVNVGGGYGVNTLAMGNGDGFGLKVGGNVNFYGAADIDRLFLDSGSSIGGNLFANMGAGSNQLFGDRTGRGEGPFNPIGSATVGGNLTIYLGSSSFIGTYAGAGTTLSVGGNLNIFAGHGTQLGGDANAPGPITLFNENLSVGGTVRYYAGVGSQVLEVSNANFTRLDFRFYSGGNTVRFTIPQFNGFAYINFGFGPGVLDILSAGTTFPGGSQFVGRFTII